MSIETQIKADGGWKSMTANDNDHKRWNQIVGGDRARLEVKGHQSNETVSVELSEEWITDSGRMMVRTIHMLLDRSATKALRDTLASVLSE